MVGQAILVVDLEVAGEDPVQDLEVAVDAAPDLVQGDQDQGHVQEGIVVALAVVQVVVIVEMIAQGLKALVEKKRIVLLKVDLGVEAEIKMEKGVEIAKAPVEANHEAEVGVQVLKRITTLAVK